LVPKDKAYVALNALIQGSAADVMKQALIISGESLSNYNAYPILTVHDEIVAETPTENAEACLLALQGAMSAAARALVPDGSLDLKAEGIICHGSYAEAK
jgi:DNA polymerase I-like protein with 3'-5' exonuclease and polymerase domains